MCAPLLGSDASIGKRQTDRWRPFAKHALLAERAYRRIGSEGSARDCSGRWEIWAGVRDPSQ